MKISLRKFYDVEDFTLVKCFRKTSRLWTFILHRWILPHENFILLKIYLEKYHIVENLTFSKDFYRKTSPTIQISMANRKTSCSWKILRQSSIRNHFFDEATCCWYYLPKNCIPLKICKFSFNLSQHSVTVRPFVCVYAIRFTIKCYKIMLLSCCTLVANSPLLLLLLSLFFVVCYVTLSKKKHEQLLRNASQSELWATEGGVDEATQCATTRGTISRILRQVFVAAETVVVVAIATDVVSKSCLRFVALTCQR